MSPMKSLHALMNPRPHERTNVLGTYADTAKIVQLMAIFLRYGLSTYPNLVLRTQDGSTSCGKSSVFSFSEGAKACSPAKNSFAFSEGAQGFCPAKKSSK